MAVAAVSAELAVVAAVVAVVVRHTGQVFSVQGGQGGGRGVWTSRTCKTATSTAPISTIKRINAYDICGWALRIPRAASGVVLCRYELCAEDDPGKRMYFESCDEL